MERIVNPEDCIFFIIAKANQNTQRFWATWISKYNLTVVQAMVINFLSGSDNISIKDLAEKVSIDNASMTGIIDRIVSSELITRKTDPQDRRSCLISLTVKGEEVAKQIHKDMITANKAYMSVFTREEQKLFKDLLMRVRYNPLITRPENYMDKLAHRNE
jgi:MarR family transcriptional regulator, organic hydroperoxide resistance regulator